MYVFVADSFHISWVIWNLIIPEVILPKFEKFTTWNQVYFFKEPKGKEAKELIFISTSTSNETEFQQFLILSVFVWGSGLIFMPIG